MKILANDSGFKYLEYIENKYKFIMVGAVTILYFYAQNPQTADSVRPPAWDDVTAFFFLAFALVFAFGSFWQTQNFTEKLRAGLASGALNESSALEFKSVYGMWGGKVSYICFALGAFSVIQNYVDFWMAQGFADYAAYENWGAFLWNLIVGWF